MKNFIRKPSVELYPGVQVTKDTELEYKTENVEQTVKGLCMHSITKMAGEGYESKIETTIYLKEGDILIFDGERRGYVKPVEDFYTIEHGIRDLECIKDLGKEY